MKFFQEKGIEILMDKYEKCEEWEIFYNSLSYPFDQIYEDEYNLSFIILFVI